MAYWDTSAILKLYVGERDSAWFLNFVAGAQEPIMSSSVAGAEMLCALHRKEHAGDIRPGVARMLWRRFRSDCDAGRIVTIPYGSDIEAEAEAVVRLAFRQPHPVLIRSLDAIHVASALAAKAAVMVATDRRLRDLAAVARLTVLP